MPKVGIGLDVGVRDDGRLLDGAGKQRRDVRLVVRQLVHAANGRVGCQIITETLERSRHDDRAHVPVGRDDVAVHALRSRRVHLAHGLHPILCGRVLVDLGRQFVNVGRQRMRARHVERLQAPPVAIRLLVIEHRLFLPRRLQQPDLVDERQQRHALPGESLSVHIHLEIRRVKVQDGRVLVGEQRLVRLWQRVRRRGRQDAHQLVERLERFAQRERYVERADLRQVGRERRVVVRVVPRPRCDPVVVVPHHPAQALDVRLDHAVDMRLELSSRGKTELLRVIAQLVAGRAEADALLVVHHVVKHVGLLPRLLLHVVLELLNGLFLLLLGPLDGFLEDGFEGSVHVLLRLVGVLLAHHRGG